MATREVVKTKNAMSMLGLLLLFSLAFLFLFSRETLRNMLKLLVITLILLAGLAAVSTPHPRKTEEARII
jgi:hypothetical protein